jgi:pyruvate formate lyase activating enzyme
MHATSFVEYSGNIAKETSSRLYEQIQNDTYDISGVRKFTDGKLFHLNYGKIASLKVKPIRKVLPFEFTDLDIGSEGNCLVANLFGNNMRITFDPNWDHSQIGHFLTREFGREYTAEKIRSDGFEYSPDELVKYALEKEVEIIIFDGGEPSVNADYLLDVSELALEIGISIILRTNGLVSPEFIQKMPGNVSYIVNLFSVSNEFYIKHCKTPVNFVFNAITELEKVGELYAIATTFIPGINDSEKEITAFTAKLSELVNSPQVLVNKFYPTYRILDKPQNTQSQLKAYKEMLFNNGVNAKIVDNTI